MGVKILSATLNCMRGNKTPISFNICSFVNKSENSKLVCRSTSMSPDFFDASFGENYFPAYANRENKACSLYQIMKFYIFILLRAADRYAYSGCGSTAYSVGTFYGGKGDLCTPDARPALLATPCW